MVGGCAIFQKKPVEKPVVKIEKPVEKPVEKPIVKVDPPVVAVDPPASEPEHPPGPTSISSANGNDRTIYILDEKKKQFYFVFKGQKHYMPKGWTYH